MTSRSGVSRRVLEEYRDDLLGIPVILRNAVIEVTDEDGEVSYEIPNSRSLTAAAAMARALIPIRLSPVELRFLRKAMEMTGRELAEALEVRPESVSRWENGHEEMGGFVEKNLRLLACEQLAALAPAIDYRPAMIAYMKVTVPPAGAMPPLAFERVVMKTRQEKFRTWDTLSLAA